MMTSLSSRMTRVIRWGFLLTAIAIPFFPVNSDESAQENLSFDAIEQLIQKNNIKTVDQFLAVLKSDPKYEPYRKNYLLDYASQSLQCGSPSAPRVISAGKDAKFIFAFSLSKN